MEELLKENFKSFIETKGYNYKNFAEDYNLSDASGEFQADLILAESDINEFLAFIEFKFFDQPDKFDIRKLQIQRKRESEDKLFAPFYLVVGNKEFFKIFKFENDYWKQILPKDFPSYDELLSLAIYRKKIQKEKKVEKEIKNEKEKFIRKKGVYSLIALIIAIGSFIATFLYMNFRDSGNGFDGGDYIEENIGSNNNQLLIIIDSLKTQVNENTNNTIKLNEIWKNYAAKDSSKINDEKYIINSQIKELVFKDSILTSKIELLENIISNDPKLILEYNNLRNDIALSNKELEKRLALVEKDFNGVNDKLDYKFTVSISLLVSLLTAIILMAIPNIFKWSNINFNND